MQLHQARLHKLAFAAAFLALLTALTIPSFAQMGGGGQSEMQQKLAALKQSAAANQQRLHHYQWVETTQVTYKGEAKPPTQKLCSYGPNGQVQKVPIGEPQQQQQSGRQGRLKERMVEKKKAEIGDYMQDVKSVIALYVPPNPQKMQQAFQAHNVSLVPGGGVVQLVFKNYAQPGDQMTIAFDPTAKKIQTLNVNTYMGEAKDVVTLAVQFGSLPDGTNYAQQTVLNATAKQIQVTTTNSQYSKLGQ
ncbi:MAG: hypothetical protein WCC92_13880 [Candidatus Korobacteraceae bacterium]